MDLDGIQMSQDEGIHPSEVSKEELVVAQRLRRGLVHGRIPEDHSAPKKPSQLSSLKIAGGKAKYRCGCNIGNVLG